MLNKKLTELIKVNLLYSNPSSTQRQRKKGKSINQIVKSTILWSVLTGFLLMVLFSFSLLSVDLSHAPGIFTHFLALFSLLLMSQLISTINNVFLDNQDLQNYLSLPVKIGTLWTAKLITIVITMIPFAIPVLAVFVMTAYESNYNVVFAIIVALLTLIFYLGSIFILTFLLTFLITQNRIFQTHKHIGNSLLLGVSTLAIVIECILLSITKNEPHTTDKTVLSPLKPIFQLITQPFSATSLITLLVLIGITTGGMFILNKLSNSGLLQIKSSYTKKRKTPAHPVVQKSLGKTLIR
ncbi:hypothetical protein BGL41_06730 [Fructilactobacillus sanfranciscensis]|uniref:hypothetical protein n=1 Tax=Fructilactobacillus sanfranciscensis TaxID=1625 RepID=UPI000CD440A3|nr:hypothetical protein [Fructilactobacillus sanfranciscensis]POH15055.1 hypothetical protein BGL41_06730 [Fructilactobacillus sanfranciscensis]